MQTARERVSQYIKSQGLKMPDVVKEISVSEKFFYSKGAIGSEALIKIGEKYINLNLHWVITGIGEMLLTEKDNQELESEKNISQDFTPHTMEAFAKLVDFNKELLDHNKLLVVGQNKLIDQAGELVSSNTKLVDNTVNLTNWVTNAPSLNAQEISLPIHQAMSRMIEAFAVKFGGEKANHLYADIHKKVFDTPENREAAGKTHTADSVSTG